MGLDLGLDLGFQLLAGLTAASADVATREANTAIATRIMERLLERAVALPTFFRLQQTTTVAPFHPTNAASRLIFAFKTLDTGQPSFALLAISRN